MNPFEEIASRELSYLDTFFSCIECGVSLSMDKAYNEDTYIMHMLMYSTDVDFLCSDCELGLSDGPTDTNGSAEG